MNARPITFAPGAVRRGLLYRPSVWGGVLPQQRNLPEQRAVHRAVQRWPAALRRELLRGDGDLQRDSPVRRRLERQSHQEWRCRIGRFIAKRQDAGGGSRLDGDHRRTTAVAYGNTTGGWPEPDDPEPDDRDVQLFTGGNQGVSAMTQTASVGEYATPIVGGIGYELSAFLGGFGGQGDRAMLTASLLDGMAANWIGTASAP